MGKNRNKRPDRYADAITIKRFLGSYLGADTDSFDARNLRHIGLKGLGIPYVVGLSTNFVRENIDLAREGSIIMVVDCRGEVLPYLNPLILKDISVKEDVVARLQKLEKTRVNDLEKLGSYFHDFNQTLAELEGIKLPKVILLDY